MRYIWKRCFAALLSVALLLALLPATARAAGFDGAADGDGSSSNPYQISTKEQLEALSKYVNDGNNCQNMYFKLTADINLGGSAENPWTPIGNSHAEFKGTFDGDGHTASGLYIDSSSSADSTCFGLFGYIGSNGTVKDLGVSGYIDRSGYEVGGIAGENSGTIIGCHSACTVIGDPAGGIVGKNHNSGTVSDCYNVGEVGKAGSNHDVGGIAGENKGTVSGCYNTGSVISGSNAAGGIVGKNNDKYKSSITNCYNVGTVTSKGSCGGIAGTNESDIPITNCYYLESAADKGVGSDDSGAADVEQKSEEDFKSLAETLGEGWMDDPFLGRPVLKDNQEPWEDTERQPCKIPDKATLEKVRDYINNSADGGKGKTFKLTKDINLEDAEWTPIGNSSGPFQGTFDGGNLTVSGLSVPSGNYVGLFGYIGGSGTVKNLGVSGSVKGGDYVGGIAGQNYGRIENCHNTADVSGGTWCYAGGIVGQNNNGTVKDCYNLGEVRSRYAGGIMGSNSSGTVTNCYNTGIIQGDDVGGIAGMNYTTVTNCYNTGSVTGISSNSVIGGIVGMFASGGVKNCYNTGTISGGGRDSGGIVGYKLGGAVTNCYYLDPCGATGEGTPKADEAFKSGEVAWLLQGGQDKQVWGQALKEGPTDNYPVLTDNPDKKVYKVTFKTKTQEEYGAKYTNENGTVTPPQGPEPDKTVFDHWAINDLNGDTFDERTTVTENMTVYAVGRKTFGGESEIKLETTYGDGLTVDLSEYVKYKSEESTAGKFTYTVTEDNDHLNAGISGDDLIIPADANAGGYTLTIKAEEQTPQYSLMSVNTYGTVPVTLTVKINIKKANGTGTVTMEDYLCGQEGVDPEPKSETNGTANVKYTYAKKGEGGPETLSDKPTTAGEYTVTAEFGATDNYNAVTATADFRITHKIPDNLKESEEIKCECDSQLRLEAEELTRVPDGLSDDYGDVDTLIKALAEKVNTGTNYAVYDVRLEIKEGAGDWHDAPEGTIPASGITVTLPYPDGTNSGYTFTVVHMFASGANAGETEKPDVTNTDDGITVKLSGLSPVCVGWTAPSSGSSGSYPSSYSVTVPSDFEGGSVTSDRASALQGNKVSLTVTPDEGHHLGSLTVTDRNGKPVDVTDNGDGTYTFTMPYSQVTVAAEFVKCGSLDFTDLDIKAWYHDYTDYVINHGLMRGVGGGLFNPDGTVTRAQMVTVLWNMRGKPVVNYYMTYSDVTEDAWYAEAVRWAASEGIAKGYGNGKFGPNDPISREQMAVMLYRYEQKYGEGGFTGNWMYRLPFTDLDKISDWAFEAVAWCNMRGVITGKGNNIFDPKGPAKRGEMAAILTRYCDGETGEE